MLIINPSLLKDVSSLKLIRTFTIRMKLNEGIGGRNFEWVNFE